MPLSAEAKNRIFIATTDRRYGDEISNLIDQGDRFDPLPLADPGTGAAIPVTRSATIAFTVAGSETNTLAIPTFVGQKLVLIDDTHSSGSRVVTVAQPVNQAGNNTLTFGAAADFIVLQAATIGGALRWRVVANDGVSLSTV